MIVFDNQSEEYSTCRLHPYKAANKAQNDFVDFVKYPELIETKLEDFIPFADTDAIKEFYGFLRWINGPTSRLATCDSAFRPPSPHKDKCSHHALCVDGRVFILFRNLKRNTSKVNVNCLYNKLKNELKKVDSGFPASKGLVGFTIQPTLQIEISNGRLCGEMFEAGENDPGFGQHLMLSFWAYGDTDYECFGNLKSVFKNLLVASMLTSKSILHPEET